MGQMVKFEPSEQSPVQRRKIESHYENDLLPIEVMLDAKTDKIHEEFPVSPERKKERQAVVKRIRRRV